jgi:flagellar basal-body rod protein FlgG
MVKSIYTPLSGANAQERVLEIIANNLANVNTTGFKRDSVTFTLLEPEPEAHYSDPLPAANFKLDIDDVLPLRGNEISYVGVAGVHRDMAQGPAMRTDNPTDIMIEGEGFFTVQTDQGTRLTRNGSFTMNREGVLVTKEGFPVLGEKGDIMLRGNAFSINDRGEVWQDNKLVDRLLVHRVTDADQLERTGLSYYHVENNEGQLKKIDQPQMRQGFLEGSNVNAIKDLTNLILAHRFYEAYQKSVQNFDSMMEKSSNSIGVVRA